MKIGTKEQNEKIKSFILRKCIKDRERNLLRKLTGSEILDIELGIIETINYMVENWYLKLLNIDMNLKLYLKLEIIFYFFYIRLEKAVELIFYI